MVWLLPISKSEYLNLAKKMVKDPELHKVAVRAVVEEYLSLGFSVIPIALVPEGSGLEKKPLVQWKEYQQRKPTKEEVEQWFNEFELFNIAIVTGSVSNLTVIDIDDKTHIDKLRKIEAPIVETGKGYQLYFRCSEKSKVLNSNPDVRIKGEGGYVIAPPSVHPSGSIYRFIVGRDLSYLGKSSIDEAINVVKKIYKIDEKKEQYAQNHEQRFSKPALSYPCFLNAHRKIPEGMRNETLFAIGMMLYANGFHKDFIQDYLHFFNSKYCTPPLTEREVESICNSIFNHGYVPTCKAIMKRLNPNCTGCPLDKFTPIQAEPLEEKFVEDEELKVYLPKGYDLFRDYQPEMIRKTAEALKDGSAAINSPTGSGKTLMFYIVSRILGVPTLVIEPNKALQDQAGEYGMVVVKGRRNYYCPVIGDTADLAPCSLFRNYKCNYTDKCEYEIRSKQAVDTLNDNGVVCVNFKNWWRFRRRVVKNEGLFVFDEAHLVIKELTNPVRVRGDSPKHIQEEIDEIEEELSDLRNLAEELGNALEVLERNPNSDPVKVKKVREKYIKVGRLIKAKENRLRSLNWLIENQRHLLFYKKGDNWYAKLEEKAILDWLIKTHRCLLVSATLPDVSIPVIKSSTYIATRKNAPIVYLPVEKLTTTSYRRKGPVIFKIAANVIKMITSYYNADKVVVHVKDIEITGKEIARYLQPFKVKLHEKGNVDKTIEEFKNDDSRFLVVAQMDTGHDFTFVKLQFIVNLPYADLSDPLWSAIAKKYGKDEMYRRYNTEMITKLIQLCGRVCRGRSDTGITFILDKKFEEVYKKFNDKFPDDFKNRVVMLL